MRAGFESSFYFLYLYIIISGGIFILIKARKNKAFYYFGSALILLGLGDAFHLIPRAVGLFTDTLDNPSATLNMWLGIGKLITSITMTLFYVLMYLFIYSYVKKKRLLHFDFLVIILTVARITLLGLKKNDWLHNNSTLTIGVVRNIPFLILGILVIVLAAIHLKEVAPFKLLWIVIIASFAFYIPVVIWASTYSWVGMFMIPKTICYLWIGCMGIVAASPKYNV